MAKMNLGDILEVVSVLAALAIIGWLIFPRRRD
jgi:hypothetical protein